MSLYRLLKQVQLEREVATVIGDVLAQRPLSANRAAPKIDYRQGLALSSSAFTRHLHVLPEQGICYDRSLHCEDWAREGECANNIGYMTTYCRMSCDHCRMDRDHVCVDFDHRCREWAYQHNQCKENKAFMAVTCPRSCHECCLLPLDILHIILTTASTRREQQDTSCYCSDSEFLVGKHY